MNDNVEETISYLHQIQSQLCIIYVKLGKMFHFQNKKYFFNDFSKDLTTLRFNKIVQLKIETRSSTFYIRKSRRNYRPSYCPTGEYIVSRSRVKISFKKHLCPATKQTRTHR